MGKGAVGSEGGPIGGAGSEGRLSLDVQETVLDTNHLCILEVPVHGPGAGPRLGEILEVDDGALRDSTRAVEKDPVRRAVDKLRVRIVRVVAVHAAGDLRAATQDDRVVALAHGDGRPLLRGDGSGVVDEVVALAPEADGGVGDVGIEFPHALDDAGGSVVKCTAAHPVKCDNSPPPKAGNEALVDDGGIVPRPNGTDFFAGKRSGLIVDDKTLLHDNDGKA